MTRSPVSRAATLREQLTSTPVLLGAASVALLDTVARWAVVPVAGTDVRFAGVAVVAAAIVLGRASRVAVAAGLFLSAASLSGPLAGIAWSTAGLVATVVAARLWAAPASWDGDRRLRWYARYATVTVAAVLALAATTAWGLELVASASFRVTIGAVLWANLAGAILCAPLVRLCARRLDSAQLPAAGRERASDESRTQDRARPADEPRAPNVERPPDESRTPRGLGRPDRPLSGAARAATVAVLLGWTAVGYATSYGFQVLAVTAPRTVSARLPDALYTVVELSGERGQFAVLVLGVVALAVLAAIVHGGRLGSGRSNGTAEPAR